MPNWDPGNLSYSPFGPATNKGGGGGGSKSSAGGFLMGLNVLKKLFGSKQDSSLTSGTGLAPAQEEGPSLEDQINALRFAAIDARYGGDGSGGRTYHPGIAPALEQYSGPTLEQIQAYSNVGRGNITGSYGPLQQQHQASVPQTAATYGQAGAAQQAGYTQAAQNIQNAIKTGQGALAGPTTGPQAGTGGGGAEGKAVAEQQAKVADIANRYRDVNAQHQWNAASANQLMSQAQQAIGTGQAQGAQNRGSQALMRFVAGTNLQSSEAQLKMAQIEAANRSAMEKYNQQEARNKAIFAEQTAGSNQSGKKEAAKMELMAKILGAQDKAGKGLSGVQGVLAYGNQQGNPKASQNFLKMIADARSNTLTRNLEASADVSGQKKKTTFQEQLQTLMGKTGVDVTDQPGMIDLIRNTPELKSLEKYAIWAPQQLYGNRAAQEELWPGINKAIGTTVGKAKNLTGAKYDDLMNQTIQRQFKEPRFLTGQLKGNPADYQLLQNYMQQQQDMSDLYNSMWEIYQGKYGRG